MNRAEFHIVDVFTREAYAGNPLAVVISPEPLADDAMQRVAVETNYSETTFVVPAPEAGGAYLVRMFTPAREVAFAGHAILGAAWVIRHHLAGSRPPVVRLDLRVGEVVVSFDDAPHEIAWFTAPPISLRRACPAARVATALRIADGEIDGVVQEASAGTTALLVPLRSLDALRRSRPDHGTLLDLARDGWPTILYLFCRETRDAGHDLSARLFFEANGVREDPATGNGAAFLAAYLLEPQSRDEVTLRIEQGHEVGRPSLVLVSARNLPREIRVGGSIAPVVEGSILL